MTLTAKRWIIAGLSAAFVGSLLFVQWREVQRREAELGHGHTVAIPASSQQCVECHQKTTPGIIDHWKGSTHANKQIGCYECHKANEGDADAFQHYGKTIATVVTPRDCGQCHKREAEEFAHSHHSKAGNILASLDNHLAEVVEGNRGVFNPHAPTPGRPDIQSVNGMASAFTGCQQCHGSKVAFQSQDGGMINADDLKPDENGKPTNSEALAKIKRTASGQPVLHASTWPNTGIGRLNLDGSRGSCSACHSRHDFSPRRARQPENCGKCHLGPDHPQKEIYEESKHGVAFRDLREKMNLDSKTWVLGKDYTQAPTCASCHMSGNIRNDGRVTHDPGERISWTNRPPISQVMDTDVNHKVITETDPKKREAVLHSTAMDKRNEMKKVCTTCHTPDYVNSFYKQYDDFVVLYNEKFARPGAKLMALLREKELITKADFDEEIEWVWFYIWHHEGRRARHGASMMAPDYAHWHGMYEVAEKFYTKFIPMAREAAEHGIAAGKKEQGEAALKFIEELLARPEHQWYEAQKKKPDVAVAPPPAVDKPAVDPKPENPPKKDGAE